jgi:hypothetical protein
MAPILSMVAALGVARGANLIKGCIADADNVPASAEKDTLTCTAGYRGNRRETGPGFASVNMR